MLRSSRGCENNSQAAKISDSQYITPKLEEGECMWKKVICKIYIYILKLDMQFPWTRILSYSMFPFIKYA